MEKEMQYIINSKFISMWGILTAGLIGFDTSWLNGQIIDSLQISPFFTNLYMGLFGIYYALKTYWYWQDKKLDKREREKRLND